MSKLEKWLEEYRWNLTTLEVDELREAVAADIAEALKTSSNTGSPKCPLCGSNSVETRTVRVCFNRSCHYINASRPLRAGA